MKSILERLKNSEILVADGAMGTQLMEHGLDTGECPEALNLTKPEIPEKIARTYLEAGADIIQTNTFGASPAKLADYRLADRAEEINRWAAEIVREVVCGRAYISGSCGPSGRILAPYGDTEPEFLYEGFERQMRGLIEGGVDMICVETMIDLQEAALAIKAARAVSPQTPVMATMTFDETPRGFFTMMGISIDAAAEGLQKAGAEIIGSNCGNGIEKMIRIAGAFKDKSTLPIIIQANAGQPEMTEGKLIHPETPEYFAKKAAALIEAGVSIIGGCCGTTPEHIAAIRKVIV